MNSKKIFNTQNLSILLGLLLTLQLAGIIDMKNLTKKKLLGGCAGTEFGCCSDGKTACKSSKNCPNCLLL